MVVLRTGTLPCSPLCLFKFLSTFATTRGRDALPHSTSIVVNFFVGLPQDIFSKIFNLITPQFAEATTDMSGRGKGGKGLGKGGAKRHRKVLRDNIQGITVRGHSSSALGLVPGCRSRGPGRPRRAQ